MAAFTATTALLASTAIASGVGGSVYSTRKSLKETKKANESMQNANNKAIAEARAAEETATEQAKVSILRRRRSIARNRTVYTSPLGITEQANTARKTLLGQ